MPDTIIIFGNTTVEKMVLVTTLRFTMCVCVLEMETNYSAMQTGILYVNVVMERYTLPCEHS